MKYQNLLYLYVMIVMKLSEKTKIMKIEVPQSEYVNPRENLEKLGYSYDGVEIDRRNKKHTMFSKDGNDFEFKGCDITGENPVITLEKI